MTSFNIEQALTMHHDQIERFGGFRGIRGAGASVSALAVAENRAYHVAADILACDAMCDFHLCQAHVFIDGNKRIAAAVMLIFLDMNDRKLVSDDEENITLFLSVASGQTSRDELEGFLRARVRVSAI